MLFDKRIKIKLIKEGSINKYVILYPYNKGKTMSIGSHILKNILKNSHIIVNIDTSLSFLDRKQQEININKIKDILKASNICLYHRTIASERSDENKFFKFLLTGKKESDRNIITFEIDSMQNNDELMHLIAIQGCEIFVPNDFSLDLVQDVFNCNFEDDEKRFKTFKYIIYINDFIGQAVLRTKLLSLKDVETICGYHTPSNKGEILPQ